MTPKTENQVIAIYRVPTLSRSKYNHVMKFGQLIEYKMRNNFLQKFCRK